MRKREKKNQPRKPKKNPEKERTKKKTEQHVESKEEKGQHTHKQGLSLPFFLSLQQEKQKKNQQLTSTVNQRLHC